MADTLTIQGALQPASGSTSTQARFRHDSRPSGSDCAGSCSTRFALARVDYWA